MKMQRVLFMMLSLLFWAPVITSTTHAKTYIYLSPQPNARYVSPASAIIIRWKGFSPIELSNLSDFIQVNGESSGKHRGQTRIAGDQMTILFQPAVPFESGEKVTVTLTPRPDSTVSNNPETFTYHFEVVETSPLEQARNRINSDSDLDFEVNKAIKTVTAAPAMIMGNGVSVPSDFPHVNITTNDKPDSGFIFIDNRGGGGRPYNIIFDNSGAPIWYLRPSDERRDFKVQPNGLITMMIRDGYGGSGWGFIALDQNYDYVRTFRAGNGYGSDEHELQVLPDGGYLIIGIRSTNVDMSKYVVGGQTSASVSETCIQEFTAQNELIFQWRAWDNFDIRDLELEDLTGGSIRFPHMNAIDIDDDGHIILSSRHLSEITKINRKTGEIIWRLGGAHNQFKFINDPLQGFRNQHAARVVGNSHYTVFDNGDSHDPQLSRACEYELDTAQMTATLVWEFREKPDRYSHYMGNVQRLPNGNTLINWAVGSSPKLTEVRPDGVKAFEMNFVNQWECYRVHRCSWQGKAKIPNLIVESQYDNITLLFNKFGDPDVDYYKIYAGKTQNPTAVLDTSKLTLKRLTNLENNTLYYFRVTAIDNNGHESPFSEEVSARANFIQPGASRVINGDFSQGKDSWIWEVTGSASATWDIENGVSHFKIDAGGNEVYAVQMRQNGIVLIQGKKYLFEFDARSETPRSIEAKVGQDVSPWTNYSKIGLTGLTIPKKHYAFSFTMEDPTDYNARVVINCGTSDADVFIDNISLKTIGETGIDESMPSKTAGYKLSGNYPNPFNPQTRIAFFLPQLSNVTIKIFNLRGELIRELLNTRLENGEHTVRFNASELASGIYFYKLEACSLTNSGHFSAVQKMMFIK